MCGCRLILLDFKCEIFSKLLIKFFVVFKVFLIWWVSFCIFVFLVILDKDEVNRCVVFNGCIKLWLIVVKKCDLDCDLCFECWVVVINCLLSFFSFKVCCSICFFSVLLVIFRFCFVFLNIVMLVKFIINLLLGIGFFCILIICLFVCICEEVWFVFCFKW